MIVLAGAALRFAALGDQSLWLDEAFTKRIAEGGFDDMLDLIEQGENTPPLYYALVIAWTEVVGTGEAGLRSLSAIAGTATIPVAYLIGRQVAARGAGLLLAALVAASPFLVWYSQEARAYALVVLIAGVTVLFALRFDDDPSRRNLAAWSAAVALAFATHYFAGFVILAEVVWLLRREATRRRVLLACVPVALVLLALVPLALEQRSNGGAQVGDSSVPSRIANAAKEFLVGEYGGPVNGIGPVAALLVAAGAALALARTSPEQRRRLAVPLAFGAAVVLLPLSLAVVGLDYFTARYMAIAWVPLFAALAAGLAALRLGPVLGAALTALFLAVSIAVPLTPRLQRDDWRSAVAALGPPATDRVIVVNPDVGFVPFAAYAPEVEGPPGAEFRTREIDVVVMTRDEREPSPLPPARGFRHVASDRDPTYVVTRFVSRIPRTVRAAELLSLRYTPDPSGLLYERAP